METSLSIQSLVPPRFKEAIDLIPENLLNKSENEIVEAVYGSWDNVIDLDVDVRRSFWKRYNIAIASEQPMSAVSIYSGACSENYFYQLLKDPKRVAFIITEPANDKVKSQYLLFLSWPKIRKILTADPAINPRTGQPDSKLMALQFEVFKYLNDRENGLAIQKHQYDINQKNLNVNVTAEQAKELADGLTPEQREERLKFLREKREALISGQQQQAPVILDTISHMERELNATTASITAGKKSEI